jgi:hypothetical protein
MLKKLIITLMVLTLNLLATSDLGMYYNTDNQFVGIYPTDGSTTINENNQDWVAVYSQGASNDWDNVIQWAWVKDLSSYAFDDDGVTKYTKMFQDKGLDQGSYEVRYFLNNTYDTYRSQGFEINGGGGDADISIPVQVIDETIVLHSTFEGDQSWIGIYKKGSSNIWANVQAWSWVTQNSTTINIANLEAGTYEARLFYNNSYNLEAKVEFEVAGGNDANIEITDQSLSKLKLNSTYQSNQKWQTWIGVYKIGEANEWGNVKAWSWVTQSITTLDISNLTEGTYEARLFYNNSYVVENTVQFTINNNALTDDEIKELVIENLLNRRNYIGHDGPRMKSTIIDTYDNGYIITLCTEKTYEALRHDIYDTWLSLYQIKNGELIFKSDLIHNEDYTQNIDGRSNFRMHYIDSLTKHGDSFFIKEKFEVKGFDDAQKATVYNTYRFDTNHIIKTTLIEVGKADFVNIER